MLKQILIPGKKNLVALYAIRILSWVGSAVVSYIFREEEILASTMVCGINTGIEIFCLSSSLINASHCHNSELREQYIALSAMIIKYWKVGTLVLVSAVLMVIISNDIRVLGILSVLLPWVLWYHILTIRGLITSCRLPNEL